MPNRSGVVSRRPVLVAAAFALLLIGLIVIALTSADDSVAQAGKKPKVKATVTTDDQATLLKADALTVAVSSNKAKRVRVRASMHGTKKRLFESRKARLARAGSLQRRVKLPLTATGREILGSCGAKRVRVTVGYSRAGKRVQAHDARTLSRDRSLCPAPPFRPVPLENSNRCDFLDPRVCLQPFPNDYFTRKDGATETGLRLNLNRESMPANTAGVHIDTTDMNRADGFSPGNEIILKVPGFETPEVLEKSGAVPIDDLQAYDNPNQRVMVINAETGERQPIWVEIDANPTAVDPSTSGSGGINQNPGNTGPVNLIIRPAENFDFGERYIVALRNLKGADGKVLPAPIGFRVYRNNIITDQKKVENRRPQMESIISTLEDTQGVRRRQLYMAWDFTVASQDSVTGRATEIRDDAFARLGDTDLSDRVIQGTSPEFEITGVLDPGDPTPPDDRDLPAQIRRRVTGTITVPCYLDQAGCPTGSKFSFDSSDELTWDEGNVAEVPFRCEIPRSVETMSPGSISPAVPGTYGHGLLGTQKQVTGQAELANRTNTIWCAMDFLGFAEQDIGTVASSLRDMSNFNKLVDRMQQGFVSFMYLGRALAHPDGLADANAFKIGGESVIDTSDGFNSRINYMGISQGGIMGGAVTALDPDVDRGVLNVPGMNYSTLLRRSVDSDEYFKLPTYGLYANYPNELERPLLLSAIQLLWDRGEGNGYAHNLTTDPLPNTNPHEVLLQPAIGDHQVANVTAEVEARTIGASVYTPALEPGRHWETNPFMGIPQVDVPATGPYTGGSMLVYYDGGPVSWTNPANNRQGSATPPNENVPPRTEWGYGGDPHGYPRASEDGMTHAGDFLAGDGISACEDPDGFCFSNGWTGAP